MMLMVWGVIFYSKSAERVMIIFVQITLPELSEFFGFSRLSSGNSGNTAVRTHPTSRAVGQDYSNFSKLPQINILYLEGAC